MRIRRRRNVLVSACFWMCIAAAAIGATDARAAWTESDVAVDVGAIRLHGTMVQPIGDGRVPTVLLIAGSGPTDRDGNQPGLHNDLLRLLAHGLAERGIASLRADKRGVGASIAHGMREEDLTLETYVSDAVRWSEFLRAHPGIGSVFIAGHSEGALIGTLAVQRTALAGLVVIAGASEPFGSLLRLQLNQARLPPALVGQSADIIARLERGEIVRDIPPDLTVLFRPSVQPYLISLLRHHPAVALGEVQAPIFIVQGDRDIQVSPDDAKRLALAARNSSLLILEGVNHVMRSAPEERDGNLALYNRPEAPLVAEIVPALADFIWYNSR